MEVRTSQEATASPASPGLAQRLLRFTLGGVEYALPLPQVSGLAACGAIRPVPGAPPVVLGLTEWRGTLLTVIDLPRLLGRPASPAEPCLIRLAPPLRGVAFYLPAAVRVDPAEPEVDRSPAKWERIDALGLVQRIESALRGSG